MPRRSAHDELEKLQNRLAEATSALRERETGAAAADACLEDARDAVREAADLDQDAAVAAAELQTAKEDAERAHLAVEGVSQRVRRAEAEVASFKEENGVRLLEERAPFAVELAGDVTRLAHELIRASKKVDAERAHQDKLIAAVPGLSPAHDGPPSEHAWHGALKELGRAVARQPELEPLVPRLGGLAHREREEKVRRQIREERKQVEIVG
jgi:hypothetical protein